ncbi:MAG: hypothetical protein F4X32_02835 [Candidatus Dadabacteria bacterium]|nr:hypothetical protein [Candidatus Dadabacteria bacterium]
MNVEDYIVINVLATMDIDDEHKKDIRDAYGKVRKLFVDASANRKLDNIFLTRDAVNYCHAFRIPNTATIRAAGADFRGHNLWVSVYNKTIRNAGLTDEEQSFLYCLAYMLYVESMYSQIVDKMCCLLAWQTDPPSGIFGKTGHRFKQASILNTVDIISKNYPLTAKLEFLAGNGFKDIAEACDVELRNAAAHLTTIIGKPTVKRMRHDTETSSETRNKYSIEGTDIRIKRYTKNGVVWEKVDIVKAHYRLEMVVWRYNAVFYLVRRGAYVCHKLVVPVRTEQPRRFALQNHVFKGRNQRQLSQKPQRVRTVKSHCRIRD